MSRYDEIIKGLEEAIEYEKGGQTATISHRIVISEIKNFTPQEIKNIRHKANMTQNIFAACIGVTKKAVEAWECGRTKPDGAARRTLGLLRDNPMYADELGIITR